MPQLRIDTGTESSWKRLRREAKRYARKATKSVMRSYHFRLPLYDMPLRFRPWFILFTVLIMVSLAFLGFTNFAHALPLNDKVLHFTCLMLATGVFYFIFDVEEDARRIWFWRLAPLISTGFVCFLLGGIVSEFVQSMLPYKEFQFGDIVANILGSSIGLYISYHAERYYRKRREISRLYRPLNSEGLVASDDEDEDDLEAGTQLLPMRSNAGEVSLSPTKPITKSRLADVWDEDEDLFDVGGDSEDEGEPDTPRLSQAAQPPSSKPSSSGAS